MRLQWAMVMSLPRHITDDPTYSLQRPRMMKPEVEETTLLKRLTLTLFYWVSELVKVHCCLILMLIMLSKVERFIKTQDG